MNTNKRLNSLITRMLSNDSTNSTSQSMEASPASSEINSTKRNLFGIRLNHDQLKQDLKEMWKEQCEIQKCRWNFDFEKMQPVKQNNQNDTLTEKRFDWHRVNISYEPNHVDNSELQMSAFNKDELKYFRQNNSLFDDQVDCDYDESDQESEEEDDLALAIPQFYKYQRRIKINDEQNRIKYMKLNTQTSLKSSYSTVKQTPAKRLDKNLLLAATPLKRNKITNSTKKKSSPTLLFDSVSTFKPIFKIKTISPVSISDKKEQEPKKVVTRSSAKKSTLSNDELIKPTPVKQQQQKASLKQTKSKTKKAITKNNKITKSNPQQCQQQTPLKLTPSVQNLIITFSENRKDTLRSATSSHSNSIDSDFNNKITGSDSSSAFNPVTRCNQSNIKVENLKQQSLLDIFKQRKRRNSTSNTSSSVANLIKEKVSQSATKSSHYLRSHTNY